MSDNSDDDVYNQPKTQTKLSKIIKDQIREQNKQSQGEDGIRTSQSSFVQEEVRTINEEIIVKPSFLDYLPLYNKKNICLFFIASFLMTILFQVVFFYSGLSSEYRYFRVDKQCPYSYFGGDRLQSFFYIESDYQNLTNNNQLQSHFTIRDKCNLTILNNDDLSMYINKWNQNFHNQHKINSIDKYTRKQKKMLLIFLRLFFEGGNYFHPLQLIENVQYKCIAQSDIGFQILFSKYEYINENDIRVPSEQFTYLKGDNRENSMIKEIIENIINGKQMFGMCEKRQCLMVGCLIN